MAFIRSAACTICITPGVTRYSVTRYRPMGKEEIAPGITRYGRQPCLDEPTIRLPSRPFSISAATSLGCEKKYGMASGKLDRFLTWLCLP